MPAHRPARRQHRRRPRRRRAAAAFTSPTNIGAYLWSTVAARDTGLIGKREAQRRMAQTIDSIGSSRRHEPSRACSTTGTTRRTLREAAHLARRRRRRSSRSCPASTTAGWPPGCCSPRAPSRRWPTKADAIRKDMDFGCYYNEAERRGRPDPRRLLGRGPERRGRRRRRLLRHGHRTSGTPATTTARSTPSRGSRRTSASPSGQIPAKHYYGTFRTFPNDNCDWALDGDQAGRRVEDLP